MKALIFTSIITFSLLITLCNSIPAQKYHGEEKIVGGTLARPGEFPFMAAMYFVMVGGFCTGTLIAPQWILTAGQCYIYPVATIYLGNYDWQLGTPYDAKQFIVHENFHYGIFSFDVALVELDVPAVIDGVNVATVPYLNDNIRVLEGTMVTAAGWGKIGDIAPSWADHLREVTVPVINHAECAAVYGNATTGLDFCLDTAGGKGICVVSSYMCTGADYIGRG